MVPPEAAMLALPVAAPLHKTLFWVLIDAVKAVGCVMIALVVTVQLLASVTVTVCVPAIKPVAIAVA